MINASKTLIAELKMVHGYDKLDNDYELMQFATTARAGPIESFMQEGENLSVKLYD